jgi:error-prone DNA polymerase
VNAPYVELHAHSGYSFLDGASHPEELVLRAVELGYPALALTDHQGLYGSMEFARAAKEAGVQPITGAEVTLAPLPFEPPDPDPLPPGWPEVPDRGTHVTLLAETPAGYANLCRLLSEAHLRSPREDPRLPLESLLGGGIGGAGTEGLILLTGCRRSPLLRALEDSAAGAEALLRRMVEAFGPGNVFVELQDNEVRGDAGRIRALCRLADRVGVPVVATGNVHYHREERHRLQDTLVAIRNRTTLDGSHPVRRGNARFHLEAPAERARRFEGRPDAVVNTLRIAERCAAFDLTRDLGYAFPDFQGGGRHEAPRVLREVCHALFQERYPPGYRRRAEAEARLETELDLVERHGLSGFFLVYRDILDLAREVAARVRGASAGRGILPPGRGRGSSVSSIICYLIGLSHIDPVANDLFLGRFLNEALNSVPDIDLDFAREIREELILEVYRRYGEEHAGLVCTFPTYRLRSAVREIGKALELPMGEVEKLGKLAERWSAAGVGEEMARIPEFRKRLEAPGWRLLAELCEDVSGLPRHISQHVGGMIISSRPLVEIVPLQPAAWEGRVLCQWEKDSCDDAGFIKIDFLALGMLSLVEEAVDLITVRGTAGAGRAPVVDGAPDLSRIDYADPAIYDRICDGDTIGMFQVESRAQIQMLRRVRPRNLEDLAVQVAIVRPGPIVGGAVNPYVRRREAMRADPDYRVPYDHPLLEEALGETLGVIIYQDQVLQVCRALAGFSDGQAEGLRRAMSRRRSKEVLEGYWEAFREGAAERGVDEVIARKVFQQVVAFSEFGFPKAHATAFGLLAYQSAWLRHYHPTEYVVALFNNQPMGFYSLDALGRDARRQGIRILLPDVNASGVECTAEGEPRIGPAGRMDGGGMEGGRWAGAPGRFDPRPGHSGRFRPGRPSPRPDPAPPGSTPPRPPPDPLRVGLGFVRGVGSDVAGIIVEERERNGPFRSLPDFLRRTPATLRRPAVENLIWVGAFTSLGMTRRELLWQAGLYLGPEEEEERRSGGRSGDPQLSLGLGDPLAGLPFPDLAAPDRLVAEYRMLRFSTELHPLSLLGEELPPGRVTAAQLPELPQGCTVTVAGIVVARQRPGTAKGYTFLLLEDEAGPVNTIVKPEVYERCRSDVRTEPFVAVTGRLQKDGTTLNVIATRVAALRATPRKETGGDPWSDLAVPDPLSYFPDPGEIERGGTAPPFQFLTALRQSPPDVKSFG